LEGAGIVNGTSRTVTVYHYKECPYCGEKEPIRPYLSGIWDHILGKVLIINIIGIIVMLFCFGETGNAVLLSFLAGTFYLFFTADG
jgi:hypothetical protein